MRRPLLLRTMDMSRRRARRFLRLTLGSSSITRRPMTTPSRSGKGLWRRLKPRLIWLALLGLGVMASTGCGTTHGTSLDLSSLRVPVAAAERKPCHRSPKPQVLPTDSPDVVARLLAMFSVSQETDLNLCDQTRAQGVDERDSFNKIMDTLTLQLKPKKKRFWIF